MELQAANQEAIKPAACGQDAGLRAHVYHELTFAAKAAGKFAAAVFNTYRQATRQSAGRRQDGCYRSGGQLLHVTPSAPGIWTQHRHDSSICQADFSHQGEVMTGGTSNRMASLSGTVDCCAQQLAGSTHLQIWEMAAMIAWDDESSVQLYMGSMEELAPSITAGKDSGT